MSIFALGRTTDFSKIINDKPRMAKFILQPDTYARATSNRNRFTRISFSACMKKINKSFSQLNVFHARKIFVRRRHSREKQNKCFLQCVRKRLSAVYYIMTYITEYCFFFLNTNIKTNDHKYFGLKNDKFLGNGVHDENSILKPLKSVGRSVVSTAKTSKR